MAGMSKRHGVTGKPGIPAAGQGTAERLRDHEQLRASIVAVRSAFDSLLRTIEERGAARVEDAARERCLRTLTRFARHLSEYLWLEAERDSLGEAVHAAPEVTDRAQELLRQHELFTRDLARIHADALVTTGLSEWRHLAWRVEQLSGRFAAHERAENELVATALFEDLGSGD
jgi:hypothetical protein